MGVIELNGVHVECDDPSHCPECAEARHIIEGMNLAALDLEWRGLPRDFDYASYLCDTVRRHDEKATRLAAALAERAGLALAS